MSSLRTLSESNRQLDINLANELKQLRTDVVASLLDLRSLIPPAADSKPTLGFLSITNRSKRQVDTEESLNSSNFEAVTKRIDDVVLRKDEIDLIQRILRSLRYSSMDIRHSNIAGAHPDTFNWIYEENDHTTVKTKFTQWLKCSDPIYWISGKPGSGKSTLVKFLISEKRTKSSLLHWAGSKDLVIASFFFWTAGTKMQKSQQGLLQSLLFAVLRQCPSLIPIIIPNRWHPENPSDAGADHWTRQELLDAFSRLNHQSISQTRFCFFIDGLDEYEGDHKELIDVIKYLKESKSIKLCVASRPWNVFEAAFGGDPVRKLYLEDLNYSDIKTYVIGKFSEEPHLKDAIGRDSRYNEIIEEIISKARGVFLWVYLVVNSLLEGLGNDDRIVDLQRRLRKFPPELDEFFRYILLSLDPIYRQQTARAFQVALLALKPLSLHNYWFLDMDEEDASLAESSAVEAIDAEELQRRLQSMTKRLNGRHKGLLEVSKGLILDDPFQPKVEFLHRTARDFLLTADMQDLLGQWLTPNFDVHLTICRTILAEIKSLRVKSDYMVKQGPLSILVTQFCFHARQEESRAGRSPLGLLNSLKMTIEELVTRLPPRNVKDGIQIPWSYWNPVSQFSFRGYDSFLTFAIVCRLLHYVRHTLEKDTSLLQGKRGRPLLDYVLRREGFSSYDVIDAQPDLQLLGLMLRLGANPNQGWDNQTVWKLYLVDLLQNFGIWPYNVRYESVKLLLLHGASKTVNVTYGERHYGEEPQKLLSAAKVGGDITSETVKETVEEFFYRVFNEEDVLELRSVLNSSGRLQFMNWRIWNQVT